MGVRLGRGVLPVVAPYDAFKTEFAETYADLDRRCEHLTESERRMGEFTAV